MGLDAAARFEDRVDRSGEHHLWRGARSASGVGQVRVDGKLVTAIRAAWDMAKGPLPRSARVLRCPGDPGCVRVEHLSVVEAEPQEASHLRSARGGGSKRETSSGVWQLTVTVGVDERGTPKRGYRNVRGTEKEATRALAAFVAEVENRPMLPVAANASKSMTVTELVEWYLDFARDDRGLDHSTLVGYREVYGLWLKGPLGHVRAAQLSAKQLDGAFGAMRRAGLSLG